MTSAGRHDTPHASRYLQQLCKHFAHKTEAAWDERSGTVVLSAVTARLAADDAALRVTLEGDTPEALARGRDVVDRHLARFAFREGFERMAWDGATDPAPAAVPT